MIHNYLSQYPVAYFCLFVTGMAGLVCLAVWARKFKYKPDENHNHSDHHWWGMSACLVGLVALGYLLALGYADNPVQALEDAGEKVVDVLEEIVE